MILLYSPYRLIWRRGKSCCDFLDSSCAFLWDDSVVPYCLDYNGSIRLGDINKQSFREIWNGPELVNLRTMLKPLRLARQHPACGPCLFGTR